MRQISIRQFRANMAKEIESLPFEVTRNGSVVAVVDSPPGREEGLCTPRQSVYTEPPKAKPPEAESVYTRQFNPYSKDKQLGKKH